MINRERNHNNSDLDYKHKTLLSNRFFQIHRLYITKKDYVQRVVGLQFVISVDGQYFPILKMERTLLGQNFFSISKILFINLPALNINVPSINFNFFGIVAKLLSFKCPRQEILAGITKILLTEESACHFYELKEKIHSQTNNKALAKYQYLKLLFFDMWLLTMWEEKIFLPYLSKICCFLKLLFHFISK